MGKFIHILQWCIVLILILCKTSGYGQKHDLIFESMPPEYEISQATVNAMLQDRHGYLWVATWSGIWRYDAYTFKQFGYESGLKSSKITDLFEDVDGNIWAATRSASLYRFNRLTEQFEPISKVFPSQNTLKTQNITSFFRDNKGRYWIGGESGLILYDPLQKRYIDVPLPGKTPAPSENIYLYAINQTADGCIWVAGSHGLYRLAGNSPTLDFQQVLLHPKGASPQSIEFHNFVYEIVLVRDHPAAIWIGTKQGLKWLDISGDFMTDQTPHPDKISYFECKSNQPNSLSNNFVSAICESDYPVKNAIWVATFNGLNLLTPQQGLNGSPTAKDYQEGELQRFFAKDTEAGGLLSNNLYSLFCDRSGIIWIGTNKGLNKLDPRFSNFNLFQLRRSPQSAHESISYLSQTTNNIWVGTISGGIFRIPLSGGTPIWANAKHYVLSDANQSSVTDFISAVFPDNNGNIWVLTQGAGVFKFKEQDVPLGSGVIRKAELLTRGNTTSSLGNDYVMSGLLRQDGKIWLGFWDAGINLLIPDATTNSNVVSTASSLKGYSVLKFTNTTDQLVDFRMLPVVVLAETKEQGTTYLWAATRGGGIFQLLFNEVDKSLTLVRHLHQEAAGDDKINVNFMTSLITDTDGNLWATAENGFYFKRNNQNTFVPLISEDFSTSAHLEAVIPMENGQYWLSSEKGVVFGQEDNSVFYMNRNGQRERSFNSSAAIKTNTGILLFGGNSGITYFKPNEILIDTTPPPPVITGLRLFNKIVVPGQPTDEGFLLEKSITQLDHLTLTYRDNVVSFEFSALHYSYSAYNKFAYKLEGFDPDWIYTDAAHRLAHYTNLPNGEYVFKVKAANADGVWNPKEASLPVTVLPPFWRTIWAYLFYVLVVVGLFWLALRLLFLRADYENKIRIERLEKEKLEEVNQMKLIFFTNISHELKTPLTLIVSPLEEMLRRRIGDSTLQSTFSMMHRNAVRLLSMINQLLDIRKVEAGLMRMEVSEGNIVQFVGEIYLSFRELANQRRIHFEFIPPECAIMAYFDADQLEKVFFNLLSNAFKFTPPEGKVFVAIGTDDAKHQYYVRITDNGKGIPVEKLPYIFERYFQAEEHIGQEDSGTGIGLSLVKYIVERHQGNVEVESAPGQGAVFTVWLPLGKTDFPENEIKQNTKNEGILDWFEHHPSHEHNGLFGELSNSFSNLNAEKDLLDQPISENTATETNKNTILIIEDNSDIRQYLSTHLSKEFEVVLAEDAEQGLDIILKSLPDLILCDIAMPGMDGIQLTRQVKGQIETSHIPIILLTARTALLFKMDGLESGADDYITKPFNFNLLQLRIRNLITSRKGLRERYAKDFQRFDNVPNEVSYSDLDEQFLTKVSQIIHEHIADPEFSVDDLARKLLMNRKQVYRKIKALTDSTPVEFIRAIRLKQAAVLLRSHQYTISEITYMVGFQDFKYFRERFKAFFGVNPSDLE
jgi:signal transduction histidine kinase/DNA-binding response OmpR family regulator/ligand-binding sensor domain-containing protein